MLNYTGVLGVLQVPEFQGFGFQGFGFLGFGFEGFGFQGFQGFWFSRSVLGSQVMGFPSPRTRGPERKNSRTRTWELGNPNPGTREL
jgi:hypothetical protein